MRIVFFVGAVYVIVQTLNLMQKTEGNDDSDGNNSILKKSFVLGKALGSVFGGFLKGLKVGIKDRKED